MNRKELAKWEGGERVEPLQRTCVHQGSGLLGLVGAGILGGMQATFQCPQEGAVCQLEASLSREFRSLSSWPVSV